MEEDIQSRKGKQQLKEEPPDSQVNESIQTIASENTPVEKAIQSKEGWQQLKEEPPDSQGNTSIKMQEGKAATEGRAT